LRAGVVLILSAAAAGFQAPQPADLVLRGGKVVTVDPRQPQAEALAVRGPRIAAVGTNEAIARHIGPQTRVIELEGKLLIPGFIEGHGHFLSLGETRMGLDLSKARSWDEIVRLVAGAARKLPAGAWVIGRGWHQEKWDSPPEPNVGGYPVHNALSP
jgi:predicted amidohydrolase YtcJ